MITGIRIISANQNRSFHMFGIWGLRYKKVPDLNGRSGTFIKTVICDLNR